MTARPSAVTAVDEPGRWLDRSVFLRNLPGVAAIVLVWTAAAIIFPDLTRSPAFLLASGLVLLSLTISFVVPWHRVPAWLALLPPLLLIGSVGSLAFDGLRISIVALVPIIDLARHHGRRGAVAGVLAALGASQAEAILTSSGIDDEGAMRIVVISIVFVSVAAVVTALEERAEARRRLLARQGRSLSVALQGIDVDRALLQAAIGAIGVGVVVIDGAGRVVHANSTMARLGAVTLPRGLDVATLPRVQGDDATPSGADLRGYLERALRDDPVRDETRWWTLPDGNRVALRANVARVETPRPRGAFRVLVLEDLTTEVSAVREREDFMGAVSHELRTPSPPCSATSRWCWRTRTPPRRRAPASRSPSATCAGSTRSWKTCSPTPARATPSPTP
nr:hypothetical protein [Litorihabitans aurantiacus]